MSRSRAWTFVINNHTFEDLVTMLDMTFSYLCFSFEVGKEGTPHIQGYVYFKLQTYMRALSKKMPRAALFKSEGNAEQNRNYCLGDYPGKTINPDFYEFGEMPSQGKTSWDKIEQAMQNPREYVHTYTQYRKAYREIVMAEPRDHKRRLYVIRYQDQYKFARNFNKVCFDYSVETYNGQDCLIVNCYVHPELVEHWINGYPDCIKRGYELICVDPSVIAITYKDMEERNYLVKKYYDYIRHLYGEEENCELSETESENEL